MSMKITNKDKKLLSFLFSALILVGMVYYLILPAKRGLDETEDLIEQAQLEKQEMDIQMAMYPDYQQEFVEEQQHAADATRIYYDRMASQEVDRELTGIVLSYGLECISLRIDPLVFTEASPYVRSQMARTEAAEAQESGTTVQTTQDQILTCNVRLVAEGEEEDYQRLIDLFVDGSPSIRVTSIGYQNGRARHVVQEDGSTVYVEGYRQLVLNMEMYMCDKSLYSQTQSEWSSGNPLAQLVGDIFQWWAGDQQTDGTAQTESVAQAQTDATVQADTAAETQAQMDTAAETQAQAGATAETQAQTDAAAETQAQSDATAETQVQAGDTAQTEGVAEP